MRTTSQMMIISAHLSFLEDRRNQLQTQIDSILRVIEICKSWLEEKEDNSISFEEIMLKCLEIAKNDNSGTNPYTRVDEIDESRLMVKVSNSSLGSRPDLVNILGTMSRNLYEQNKKIDSLIKHQSDNFLEFHQKMNSVGISMVHESVDRKQGLSARPGHKVYEESARVPELKVLTESSFDHNHKDSEELLAASSSEPFSSSVDLPKAMCSETKYNDSVKEDFSALNFKLETIAAQLKEFTERKNYTYFPNTFVGFTAIVSIFGQLVSPSSQFISILNEYGHTDGSQHSSYKILTCFNTVQHNEGGHYDPHTGIFKVPRDGFYLTCLNVNIVTQSPVFVGTVQRTNGCITDLRELDCVVVKLGSAQSLNILRLHRNEELCVYKASDKARICDRSRFSCFMISGV